MIGVQCAGSEVSGSHDSGFLDSGRWQISFGLRKQRSHRHFIGTEEQTQRAIDGTEVVNNIYLFDVALTYAVSRRFNLTVAAPLQHATRQRGSSTQIFHSSGIGDISVMGRLWLLKPPSESGQNISFGVGLKLPTGKPGLTDTTTLDNGTRVTLNTELVHNVTALAEKALSERMAGITVKALARAATKFALAEGATRGAQQAAGKDAGPWVGLLVGLLTKSLAVASEEADKRSWQTLPDEIHLARVWVPPGRYQVQNRLVGESHDPLEPEAMQTLSLGPGETAVLLQRVMP